MPPCVGAGRRRAGAGERRVVATTTSFARPLDLEEKERGGRGVFARPPPSRESREADVDTSTDAVSRHSASPEERDALCFRPNNGSSEILQSRAEESTNCVRGCGGTPTGLTALGVSGGVSPATPGAQCC